ncbi:MAG: FHA domain-containing protein [Deltaproteobacteria bacterium]|nr:FHA domain-containing protein [Deltaproteobacteria bacterium]
MRTPPSTAVPARRRQAVSSPNLVPPPVRTPDPRNPADPGFGRESTEPFRTRRQGSGPVAAQVIVPKGRREEGREGPVAKIVYRSPDGLETDFVLDERNPVGRHPKNKIRLNDREISKEHAVIERRGTEWWLRDLNSSNGTYVNGRRIREAKLKDNDELVLGSMRLVFQMEGRGHGSSAKDLVTILPQDPAGSTHIHAKLQEEEADFRPAGEVTDLEVLKRDYEKLRLSHELAGIGLTTDLAELLSKTMDVVFSMFPADNAVVMLVDHDTNTLVPHTVRQRGGRPKQEILLSSSIVNASLQERASVLASDAFLDPRFSGSQSIIAQGIRAAMCVPMVAHDKVLGIMHLDSRERVGAFNEKDLQILKAIANQTAIAIENARLVRQIEEEAKTRGQLSRFLPPHVVEEMVQGKGRAIQKGGQELEASVVFCDIRGFTSLSESSGPQEVVDLLNEYFERLVEVVFKRHGVLDKFIGDALMASWGTIGDEDVYDSTFNCVAAAIEFRDAVRELNEERDQSGLAPIMMGVGVNTGSLVAGYMGSRRRLEFTVIGDTVNTASRVCGIASGDQVLISDTTYRYVADRIEARYLGTRQVKGKEQEIGIYEAVRILESVRSASGS